MPAPPAPFKPFIATQLPISKLSKESYKERMTSPGQRLTGLGKWWGRKPLILVRAALLGLLLPASDDPRADRELFLKLLCMDADGLWQRKTKPIPLEVLYQYLADDERAALFEPPAAPTNATPPRPKLRAGIARHQRDELQQRVFARMPYDVQLTYCELAERCDGPNDPHVWAQINARLGTNARSLAALLAELGARQFGHVPRVGDAFCGGGSIPFEVARCGCYAYASDLNPVAALLTWAALNIVGGGSALAAQITAAQQQIYAQVDQQISAWGIEHNAHGWRADNFLYCTETRCPECGWLIPLAPAWVIGHGSRTIATLLPDPDQQRYTIQIESGVSAAAIRTASERGTVKKSALVCPHCHQSTPMSLLRGDGRAGRGSYGLRMWEASDTVPRPADVFQERLYCIRWIESYTDEQGTPRTRRHYCAPTADDLAREARAAALLHERFDAWQAQGYIPRREITPGDKTDELIRTRGWTYWHHLFTPRQLLLLGLLVEAINTSDYPPEVKAALLLGAGKCADYGSKLARWHPHATNEKVEQTFSNQALNTLFNYASRGMLTLTTAWYLPFEPITTPERNAVQTCDVRDVTETCDIWITDPPYADAINYHELTEYFLAWYAGSLPRLFPQWYTDSKRVLAIQGVDHTFRSSMVAAYRQLAAHMPANGYQIVMFTHQDASVWADLTLILWAAGLRVIAAWSIATETESALKAGNYVQGTVLLVLQKQTTTATAFLDEIYPQVEDEVQAQLAAMLALDDRDEPNFGDADYQLAAYAAALRVLTTYKGIEEIDIAHELERQRRKGEVSPLVKVITNAVRIASDYLVPRGLAQHTWKRLHASERFYLKGLDLSSQGERRVGAYQELARGFGVKEYTPLLASTRANEVRPKTASELGNRYLDGDEFGRSTLRAALFAVREVVQSGKVQDGMQWLRSELPDYWDQRKLLIELLSFLSSLHHTQATEWADDAEAARVLAGALENDHV